jgi:multiple sugar transport system permease protein
MAESAKSVAVPPVTVDAKQKILGRRARRRNFRQNDGVGYLFISPWLIGFMLFTAIPILMSLGLAFTDYDILGDWDFIGLENFARMNGQDIRYERAVRATLRYVAFSVPLRLIFALGVAMLLNTKRKGVYLYRAAFYAPSVVGGSVAVAVMWRQLFGNDGVINGFLGMAGWEGRPWLGDPQTAIWTLILLAVWQFGSPMLIFLAGLKQIPEELYEAASIDGANAIQQFRRITLPLLTPIIFFNLVMQTIAGFKQFTQAFVITEGRPLDTTLFYVLYLYQQAFQSYKMGYAAAMAWVMLIVVALLTFISFKLSSLWVFYETKED